MEQETQTTAEAPAGGYYIMINHEQTADHRQTLTQARERGRELCDQEPFPSSWSIYDSEGKFVENIERTDGKSLSEQVTEFNKKHGL